MHAFPDADDRELRAHCLSTLIEYEESMRALEEAKDSGELDSDGSSSEDEDELTGIELLRDLDPPACVPPQARPQ
jgi:aryl-alcohol dehydrogenase-like predicted oxidoreductase